MAPNIDSNAFEAILLRERSVDEHGNLVDEDIDDVDAFPLMWALAERLTDEGVPPQVFVLGRCRLLIISADDSEFAKLSLLEGQAEGKTFIRARLTMNEPNAPQVRGGDLVAVMVSAGTAVVYELLLDASEIPPLEPGAFALVTLPPGESCLQLRSDLGLIGGDDSLLARSMLQGEA